MQAVLFWLSGHWLLWVGRHDLLMAAMGSKWLTGQRFFMRAGPLNVQGWLARLVQSVCAFWLVQFGLLSMHEAGDIQLPAFWQWQLQRVFVQRHWQPESMG